MIFNKNFKHPKIKIKNKIKILNSKIYLNRIKKKLDNKKQKSLALKDKIKKLKEESKNCENLKFQITFLNKMIEGIMSKI